MAIQCTVCGTQTRAGAKFCHACGTPIATTSLPSTLPLGAVPPVSETRTAPPTASQPAVETEPMNIPSAYLSQTPQTYHTPPQVAIAPAKKSGNTLKVVLISLAVIMALGIALIIGVGYYVGKRASQEIAKIKQNGSLPTVSDSNDSLPDEKLGVPIYPGAKREKTVSGSFGPFSGGVVIFSSEDSPDEVAEFYRAHFKKQKNPQVNEVSDDAEGNTVFQNNGEQGPRVITIKNNENESGKNSNAATEIIMVLGKGLPGMIGHPPPPPPPGRPPGAEERRLQDIRRMALEQAEKALREAKIATEAPPPPPPPKH